MVLNCVFLLQVCHPLKLPRMTDRKVEKRVRVRRNESGGIGEVLEEAVIVFFLLPCFSLRPFPPTFSSHHFWFSFPRCSGRNTKQAAQALMILGRLASFCYWLDPNIPHLIPVLVSVDSFTVSLFALLLCLTRLTLSLSLTSFSQRFKTEKRDLVSLCKLKHHVWIALGLQFRFQSSLCLSQHLNIHNILRHLMFQSDFVTSNLNTSLFQHIHIFVCVCVCSVLHFLQASAVRMATLCWNLVDHFSFPSSFPPLGATLLTRKPIPSVIAH